MARILVVDDNRTNVEVLEQFFHIKGHEVLVAVNGAEALALLEPNPPDVIIMDMSMPVLSGWDATRKIKENPKTSQIPILALTAHAMDLDERRAMEVGCDGYMVKPMDLFELDATVQSLLNRR